MDLGYYNFFNRIPKVLVQINKPLKPLLLLIILIMEYVTKILGEQVGSSHCGVQGAMLLAGLMTTAPYGDPAGWSTAMGRGSTPMKNGRQLKEIVHKIIYTEPIYLQIYL